MKKIISLILALAMVFTLVPAAVWADDAEDEIKIYDAENYDPENSSPIANTTIAGVIDKDSDDSVTVEDAFKYASRAAALYSNGLIFVQQKDVTNAKICCNASEKVNVTYDLNGYSFTLTGVEFKADAGSPNFHLTITDSSEEKTGTVTNKLIDDISSSNILQTAFTLTSALTNIFTGKSDCLVSLAIANKDNIDFGGTYELNIEGGTFGFNPESGIIDTLKDLTDYLDTIASALSETGIYNLDEIIKNIKNGAYDLDFVADGLTVTENTDGTFSVGIASVDLKTDALDASAAYNTVSPDSDDTSLTTYYKTTAVGLIKEAIEGNTAVTEFVNDNVAYAISDSMDDVKEKLLYKLNDALEPDISELPDGCEITTSVLISYAGATAGLDSDSSTVYINGISYKVKPQATVTTADGKTATIEIENEWIDDEITFRLPVAENAGEKVEVFHKSEANGAEYESLGYYTVYEQDGYKFIEVSIDEFSYFKYEIYESSLNELFNTLKSLGTVVLGVTAVVGGFSLASTMVTKLSEAEETAAQKADEISKNITEKVENAKMTISEKVDSAKTTISEKLKDTFKTKAQKEAEEKEAAEKAAAEEAARKAAEEAEKAAAEEAARKAAEEAEKAAAEEAAKKAAEEEAAKKAAEEEAAKAEEEKKAAEEAEKSKHLNTKTGYKTCSGIECPIAKYTDLDMSSSYHDAIHWALENNVMNGVTATKFGPNQTLTRAQLVTILFRLDGEKAVNYEMTFTDLRADQYYVEAIRWASANKIVNGVTPTSFCPESSVTREQMYTILYNFAMYRGFDAEIKNSDVLTHFSDLKTMTSYAQTPVFWAYGNGLINKSATTLRPLANASRVEAAEMLMLFSQL